MDFRTTSNQSAIGAIATLLLVSGIGPAVGRAQGPMTDRVDVNLPYAVTLGSTTLQPGDYTIQELPGSSKERVLLIYSDHGKKYQADVLTIPTFDNRTPDSTKLTLHHYGPNYYFDKVWISGRNYGYEFVVPDNVKSREQEAVTLAGNYRVENTEPTAAAAPAPTPEPAPAPVAEATPPPTHEPAPQAAPTPAPEPAQQAETSANREARDDTNRMPATASNWTTILLSGGILFAIGLLLRYRSVHA